MINVRRAQENDSSDVFKWRNDVITRKMSHTKEAAEWEGHSKWFTTSLTHESRLLVMCEESHSSSNVAIVRFDVENFRALISINLSPLMRGRGLAKTCLNSGVNFFKTEFPHINYIDAEIKSINLVSRRAFESVGFQLVKETNGVLYYENACR